MPYHKRKEPLTVRPSYSQTSTSPVQTVEYVPLRESLWFNFFRVFFLPPTVSVWITVGNSSTEVGMDFVLRGPLKINTVSVI